MSLIQLGIREPSRKLSLIPRDSRCKRIDVSDEGMTVITPEHPSLKKCLMLKSMRTFAGKLDDWLITIAPHPKFDRAAICVIVSPITYSAHIFLLFL